MVTSWGVGTYPLMAQRLEPAARAVVEVAAVAAGERVLDVATGTGTAALLAAQRGARVIGVDWEPRLLQVAQRRADASGLQVRWLNGDVTALPVADASVEVVLSVFGVMYAADHAAAAEELFRIAAPGGRVVLASWTRGGLMPAMGQLLAPYLPPPPAGARPPSRWGDPDALGGLLAGAGLQLAATELRQVAMQFPDVKRAADFLLRTAGHVLVEQQRLTEQGRWSELQRELTGFVHQRAQPETDDRVELTLDYLLASATKARAEHVALHQVALSDPRAEAVLLGLAQEYQQRYGTPEELTSTSAAEFDPPAGAFLVVLDEHGQTIAGGGLRRLNEQTAEAKRMWTAPQRRRSGLARLVLTRLEQAARDQGYQRVRLETGPAQPEAQALYLRSGYQPIPTYGRYPKAHAFEREL